MSKLKTSGMRPVLKHNGTVDEGVRPFNLVPQVDPLTGGEVSVGVSSGDWGIGVPSAAPMVVEEVLNA